MEHKNEDKGSQIWTWQDSFFLSRTPKWMPKTSTSSPLEAIKINPVLLFLEVTRRCSYHSLPPHPDPNVHTALDAPDTTPLQTLSPNTLLSYPLEFMTPHHKISSTSKFFSNYPALLVSYLKPSSPLRMLLPWSPSPIVALPFPLQYH